MRISDWSSDVCSSDLNQSGLWLRADSSASGEIRPGAGRNRPRPVMHRGRAALCGRGIWCFNAGLTRSDRHGQGSGPAGEVAMLIKHPRADMAANAAKPASEAAMERAEAEEIGRAHV